MRAVIAAVIVVAAPVAVAQVVPVPVPVPVAKYSPVALVELVDSVCREAEKRGSMQSLAKAQGLGEPQPAPADLSRALPDGARTWSAPSADGSLFLFGYGEEPLRCGAAVMRPLPEVAYTRALDLLQARGFAIESSQLLNGATKWSRLKSSGGQFIDLMEYPSENGMPAVLRADLLPS